MSGQYLAELVCQITEFLADDVPFPTTASDRADGELHCATACGAGGANCTYDCASDSFITC